MSCSVEQTMPFSGTGVNNGMLTSKGAAAFLGFADQTLRKMRIAGNGPPYLKLNRSVRYRVRDLQAWLDARVTSSTSAVA